MLALLIQTSVILHDTRTFGFWGDDWSWICRRLAWNLDNFMLPFNGQMQALLTLAYKLMFVTVGLSSTWPYRLLLMLMNALCVVLLWRLLSPRVGRWLALVPAVLLMGLGAAWEDFVMQIQINYLGAIACALAALLLLDRRDRRGDVLACILLCAAWMWCSVGLPFAVAVAAELAWSRATWRRLWIALIPLALYVVWYMAYGVGASKHGAVFQLPTYFARASGYTFAGIFGLVPTTLFTPDVGSGPGAFIFLACVAVLVIRLLRAGTAGLPPRTAGAMIGYIALWIAIGLNRLGNPSDRYIYPAAVFVLIAAGGLVSWRRLPHRAYVLITLGLAWVLIAGYNVILEATIHFGNFETETNADIGAIQVAGPAMDLSKTLQVQINKQLDSLYFSAAQYLVATKQLHSEAGFSVSALLTQPEPIRARVDADLLLFEAIAPSLADGVQPAGSGPKVDSVAGATTAVTGPCTKFIPTAPMPDTLLLSLPIGQSLLLKAHSDSVSVNVRRFAQDFSTAARPGSAASFKAPIPSTISLPASKDSVLIPFRADTSSLPWNVSVSSTGTLTVCTAPSRTPQG